MGQHLSIKLEGHLSPASLASALSGITPTLAQSNTPQPLLIDCLGMTGYDADARTDFVTWNAEYRHKITRVAILTDKRLWLMVIATMSLASKQQMRGFRTESEAIAWLDA